MRLAFFVDQKFWFDGAVYSTDEAYILFPASFVTTFDQVVFLGRLAPEPIRQPYALEDPALTLCPLPYYESLYDFWRTDPRLFVKIREIIQAQAKQWDLIVISGPNPVGQYVAQLCAAMGIPVVLIVRQNLIPLVRFANRGIRRVLGVTFARVLEWQFRRLARGRTVFAVGQEMVDAYRHPTTRVHNHFVCLINNEEFATFAAMPRNAEPRRLLFVGRLSLEKGYHYLFAALVELKARGINCSLDVVGSGHHEDALKAVTELGLEKEVTFHGYVPYGSALFAFYQRATALVVPSLSEGFPQVINEALCVGLPTIATTVGGIPSFLTHNETALLVPPGESRRLADAIAQLLTTPSLQEHLHHQGQALMRNHTLEANRDKMVRIIQDEVLRQ